ncbi:MAG TPA: PHP domain-containing protein, partial [Asanoa sp.]
DWQKYGCERAALCGVHADRVINTWPAGKLVDWAAAHA